MTVGQLLTALSMVDSTGSEIPFISDTRTVQSASGLSAIASREVVVARGGRSGSRNLTRYRDDAQIVINGMLVGQDADDTWAQYDQVVGAFADAVDTDRLLKWTAGGSLALQRNVRLTSLDGPLDVGPDAIAYQVTLRASDPNAYSQVVHTAYAVPLGSTSGGGWVMPFVFPFTYQPGSSTVAAFTNAGFVPTPPTFMLTGFLQNPTIQLEPGIVLAFNGTIAAGDVLTIDVDQRTILLNGTDNRRSMLDTSQSTWFNLPRGSGTVSLVASAFAAGANLSVSWRDARS